MPALQDIYADDFIRFVSPKPRALDLDAVTAYAEKLAGIFEGVTGPKYELSYPQMRECLERFRQFV